MMKGQGGDHGSVLYRNIEQIDVVQAELLRQQDFKGLR